MHNRCWLCLVTVLGLACLAGGSSAQMRAIVGGTLVNPGGKSPSGETVILVDGNRITAVGIAGKLSVPPGS